MIRARYTGLNIIGAILILLFTYTAVSKLLNMPGFIATLLASPLAKARAELIAWCVVLAECVASFFLLFPPTRLAGFYISFVLLAVFTTYIGYMLITYSSLPCSCGGVLRQLSWGNHLILNIILSTMALAGIYMQKRIRALQTHVV